MKLLLVASILLASVGSLLAVECYSCSTIQMVPSLTSGDDCKDPFVPSTNTSTCSDGTYCAKAVAKMGGEIATVDRSCTSTCTEMCASMFGIEGCNYCCQSDLCNKAESVTFSLLATIAMVTAGLKLTA